MQPITKKLLKLNRAHIFSWMIGDLYKCSSSFYGNRSYQEYRSALYVCSLGSLLGKELIFKLMTGLFKHQNLAISTLGLLLISSIRYLCPRTIPLIIKHFIITGPIPDLNSFQPELQLHLLESPLRYRYKRCLLQSYDFPWDHYYTSRPK